MKDDYQFPVRLALPEDAAVVARLLFDFNNEFETTTPPMDVLEPRCRAAIAVGQNAVFLAGDDPVGLAMMSFRQTVWETGPAAMIDELYVVPDRRGIGIGRALLEAVLQHARAAGCAWIELNTGESDLAARALYESTGFTNIEESSNRPRMLYYEIEL